VFERIPPSIRVVAVSQRGHGDSDKPALGYGVEHFAADVVPVLDVLGIERAVLAGHSGSCMVARRVAIDHPDRIAGLVLESSPTTLCANAALEDFVSSVVSGLEDRAHLQRGVAHLPGDRPHPTVGGPGALYRRRRRLHGTSRPPMTRAVPASVA
jgi:pimeloyl-ACP methyl ester carboxylesterase